MENWAETKLRFQTEFRSRGLPNRCLQFRTEYFAFPKENFIAGPTTGKDEKRPLNHNRMAVKWVPPLAFILPYAVFIDKHKNEGGLFLPIERQSCQSHKHDLLLLKRGPKDCRAVFLSGLRNENWKLRLRMMSHTWTIPKKTRHEFTKQVDRNVGGSRNSFSTMLQSQMDFDLIFSHLSSHFN